MKTTPCLPCLLLLMCLLAFPGPLRADREELRFRTLQTGQGLSNNDVNCIMKDSHGFMWVGTASGLNRYDGYEVRTFRGRKTDSLTLHDNYIEQIMETESGDMWVRAGGHYTLFDPAAERFSLPSEAKWRSLGLPSEPSCLLVEGSELWLAAGSRLFFLGKDMETAREIRKLRFKAPISGMAAVKGHLYAVSKAGELKIVGPGGSNIVAQTSCHKEHRGAPDDHHVFVDSHGRAWVYSVKGAAAFSPAESRWTEPEGFAGISSLPVRSLSEDDSGNLWFGTDNHGLIVLSPQGDVKQSQHRQGDAFSLPNNTVKALCNSRDGGMWAGTYKKGVAVNFPSEFKFSSFKMADVNCMSAVAGADKVWVGTDQSGLMVLDPRTRQTASCREEGPVYAITAITPAGGGLWLGTFRHGLKLYKEGKYTTFGVSDGLASDNVWSVLPENDGRLWLGTLGGGLQLYDPAKRTGTAYTAAAGNLPSDYVISVVRGRDGAIYAGTTEGICRIRPGSAQPEMCEETAGLTVTQLLPDNRGWLWVGTRDGLYLHSMENGTVHEVELGDGWTNPYIMGLAEGSDRSLWVTVGNEIFNVTVQGTPSRPSFTVRAFGEHDGMASATFNERSVCPLSSGELLAGTNEGIVAVNPLKINLDDTPPSVMFTGLWVNNTRLRPGDELDGKVFLPQAADYAEEIVLDGNHNDFTVTFSTDIYSNSEGTSYRYRLLGLSTQWEECVPGEHHASFNGLAPGSYTLEVSARNFDGVEGVGVRSLKIRVVGPWWTSLWAKSLYAAFAACLAFSAFRTLRRRKAAETEKTTGPEHEKELSSAEEGVTEVITVSPEGPDLIEPAPRRIEITSLDRQLVDRAVRYVEENMSRTDLSVEELALNLGMSRVHLYKKLTALTGKTPIEFIRIMRLKRAAQYLEESQLNVAQIAYRSGFNNPKYFSRYFKEQFGVTPTEYQSGKTRECEKPVMVDK